MSKTALLLGCASISLLTANHAFAAEHGLLFHLSGDKGATADFAAGDPVPNFIDKVRPIAKGKAGPGLHAEDDGILAWNAPGNIQAQRGTLSFFWRSGYPVGVAPFVIFRVGYADHTSWDMAFLRIDWNGHGFDAFVTDNGLARSRVSFRLDQPPKADAWTHLAFTWDETTGVQLFVDGKLAASKSVKAVYDSGLDQFGIAGRVIAPHQVQSRYNFLRGGEMDEIRVYDHALEGAAVAALARNETPAPKASVDSLDDPATRAAWNLRYGWNKGLPPYLDAPSTRVRKVEFTDAKDMKQWMWRALDGISETTWPGVYNRSRLEGRDDYFPLPDWNVYVEGGKTLRLTLPDEPVNRIEIQGPAFGDLTWAKTDGADGAKVAARPKGQARTITTLDKPLTGGVLSFTNTLQETPIQEIWAYDVGAGAEPKGAFTMNYTVKSEVAPDYTNLTALNAYVAGRHPAGERAVVTAVPDGAPTRKRPAAELDAKSLPIVHVMIPSGFGAAPAAQPLARNWAYGWENARDGLDGIAVDLPALKAADPNAKLIALNIQVKDPIWPGRNMIDVSVSVKPGEARTLWLDLRDRILTDDSLYLTVASNDAAFGPRALDGAKIRLVFKDREAAKAEHIADRFNQVKDNWAFLVEEHTTSQRQGLYRRIYADITDLLRVDPDHKHGREYWGDITFGSQGWPAYEQPKAPDGVPLWAFRQTEDLKRVSKFINWWIDERQVPYGDFGGGISDDSDLSQQWPGLAMMGVQPDKIRNSVNALADAAYKNGMFTNGLATIATDELHAYEEGINTNSLALVSDYGDPLAVERLFTTVKALPRIIDRNPAGHVHFNSNWFSGSMSYREGPWEWQKPYSFGIVHPAIAIGDYNGDKAARDLVIGLADGYLAHGKPGPDGQMSYPNEINWRTDAERGGTVLQGSGAGGPFQLFWTAWRWTGDDKYLAPIRWRIGRNGWRSLNDINENAWTQLGLDDAGRAAILKAAERGGGFERYVAWSLTGDKKHLEDLYAAELQWADQHMYMHTEGHWWSDRVEIPSDLLQRSRLGGIANKRGQMLASHRVSWTFGDASGEDVAVLIKDGSTSGFKVIAYNLTDKPVTAVMTGWDVKEGQWSLTQGVDADGDDAIDGEGRKQSIAFGRTGQVSVVLPPRRTAILDMALTSPGDAPERRADLGIGRGDVTVKGRTVTAVVHSLGAADTNPAMVELVDAQGAVLAKGAIPALKAPADLEPRTHSVGLTVPGGIKASGLRVRLVTDQPQITRLNDETTVP
ncbi:LamG domain-containing protein [Caulobacter segnis]|uniref:LamG-like jellyroll fold domain-containing protein n=1 Tax=Caulobacter segnis TaxID=88688 RepID=UPI0024107DCA|nr:LamG-like jellyroll fold domain-containing protein [Caulobacter segnis]MDG2520261.1 LamG domain-containing protein [Caulobacter segnis]